MDSMQDNHKHGRPLGPSIEHDALAPEWAELEPAIQDVFSLAEGFHPDKQVQATNLLMFMAVSINLENGTVPPRPDEASVWGLCVHRANQQIMSRLAGLPVLMNAPPANAAETVYERLVTNYPQTGSFLAGLRQKARYLEAALAADPNTPLFEIPHASVVDNVRFTHRLRVRTKQLLEEEIAREMTETGKINWQRFHPELFARYIESRRSNADGSYQTALETAYEQALDQPSPSPTPAAGWVIWLSQKS